MYNTITELWMIGLEYNRKILFDMEHGKKLFKSILFQFGHNYQNRMLYLFLTDKKMYVYL